MKKTLFIILLLIFNIPLLSAEAQTAGVAITELDLNGNLNQDGGEFIISGQYHPHKPTETKDKLIYASKLETEIRRVKDKIIQRDVIDIDVIHGTPEAFAFTWQGEFSIQSVTGKHLDHWSLQHNSDNTRTLNLVPTPKPPPAHMRFVVVAELPIPALPLTFAPTQWLPEAPNPYTGMINIFGDHRTLQCNKTDGLSQLETNEDPSPAYTFAYANTAYSLQLTQLSEAAIFKEPITIDNFKLQGQLFEKHARFTLQGRAIVTQEGPSSIPLLAGRAALIEYTNQDNIQITWANNSYHLKFKQPGIYPFSIDFAAAIESTDGWKNIEFKLLDSAIRPVQIVGFSEATTFSELSSFAPQLEQDTLNGSLPIQSSVLLQWKSAGPEVSAELFYSSSSVNYVQISPGYLKQLSTVDLTLLQGEMETVTLLLKGQGEVTQVSCPHLLKWEQLESTPPNTQQLQLTFNQAITEAISLKIETQTPLNTFPITFSPLRITPEATTQHQGYYVFETKGAVRIETLKQTGLVQVSATNLPIELSHSQPTQSAMLVYRFASAEHAIQMNASDILPEYNVSNVTIYHYEKSSDSILANIELDIKEAPLREWTVWIPRAYSVAKIEMQHMSDYVVIAQNATHQALTIQFSQPLAGRQIAKLELEQNQRPLPTTTSLPPIYFPQAKNVRGYIGVTGELGLRLSSKQLENLAETPAAYFPEKADGLQLTYRMRDRKWQADIAIEELAHVVQADALNLFSVGDGIAYGSTVINYQISGAPLTSLSLDVPESYRNVEFSGHNIRSWKADGTQYTVELQSPTSGAYALMATYDAPINRSENHVSFIGLTPVGVESEQGYVLVISKLPFKVSPIDVSTQLIRLEPQEIPAEYRLLFDAPLLASYQYTQRPFAATLSLTPFTAGMSIDQVVEFAAFDTQVSKAGELLTQARYAIKSKGQSHFQIRLPQGVELWEALVNGSAVTPIISDKNNSNLTLIPLPPEATVNELIHVELKIASQSQQQHRIPIALPQANASILTSEWRIQPDEGNHIYFLKGSLKPTKAFVPFTGIRWLNTLIASSSSYHSIEKILFIAILTLFVLCKLIQHYIVQQNKHTLRKRLAQVIYALTAIVLCLGLLGLFLKVANYPVDSPAEILFSQPIQQPNATWNIVIANYAAGELGSNLLHTLLLIAGMGLLLGTRWLIKHVKPLTLRSAATLGWVCVFAYGLLGNEGPGSLVAILGIWILLQLFTMRLPRSLPPASAFLIIAALGCYNLHPVEASMPQIADEPFYEYTPNSNWQEDYYVQSIEQQVAIGEGQALVAATLNWKAETESLSIPFLYSPAVLVDMTLPNDTMVVSHTTQGTNPGYILTADEPGVYQVRFSYRVAISSQQSWQSLTLPTSRSLVNQVTINFPRLELDVRTDDAASIVTEETKGQTITRIHFQPTRNPTIQWRPRSRDTKAEQSVFYAELSSLYLPKPGVVEGFHQVSIQQAQGELRTLHLQIPPNQNVTQVTTPLLESWYYNPENRNLTLQLQQAVQAGFTANIHTQAAPPALPYTFTCGAIVVHEAAGQSGAIGLATHEDIQITKVETAQLSPINEQDFAWSIPTVQQDTRKQPLPHKAFRYSQVQAQLTCTAQAVEPDIRVSSEQTLSLGDDRVLLSIKLKTDIRRAGIFKLSFTLPDNYDIETISSPALSQWTEFKEQHKRIVNLHLKGKTMGEHDWYLTLTGPGIKDTKLWQAPRLRMREATKQIDQIVAIPETGLRLNVHQQNGLSLMAPKTIGVHHERALAFRTLQEEWNLMLAIEMVEPWIQTQMIHDVLFHQGTIETTANIHYSIQNTGIKMLQLSLPANAIGVSINGHSIASALPQNTPDSDKTIWVVQLERRVIGNYNLKVAYREIPTEETSTQIASIIIMDTHLHRGYLTISSRGRTQATVATPLPPAVQSAEWQNVPHHLRSGLPERESSLCFRMLESEYPVTLDLKHHEAAFVLPAQVESLTLNSVLSDSQVLLTHTKIILHSGDKRMLKLKLPPGSEFWFAMANTQSSSTWRDGDTIMIPMPVANPNGLASEIEFLYAQDLGSYDWRSIDTALVGPSFDLPLQAIAWHLFLPQHWEVNDWGGTLEPEQTTSPPLFGSLSFDTYQELERNRVSQRSQQAEKMLQIGNNLLQKGDSEKARYAFESAYNLSKEDIAFNEDARVQLNNLKTQQAVDGLAQRWNQITSDLAQEQAMISNQQQSLQNPTTLFQQLAQRLVEQQNAALAVPQTLQATLPQQGKRYTFTRSLQIEPWSDMEIQLSGKRDTGGGISYQTLLVIAGFIGAVFLLQRGKRI